MVGRRHGRRGAVRRRARGGRVRRRGLSAWGGRRRARRVTVMVDRGDGVPGVVLGTVRRARGRSGGGRRGQRRRVRRGRCRCGGRRGVGVMLASRRCAWARSSAVGQRARGRRGSGRRGTCLPERAVAGGRARRDRRSVRARRRHRCAPVGVGVGGVPVIVVMPVAVAVLGRTRRSGCRGGRRYADVEVSRCLALPLRVAVRVGEGPICACGGCRRGGAGGCGRGEARHVSAGRAPQLDFPTREPLGVSSTSSLVAEQPTEVGAGRRQKPSTSASRAPHDQVNRASASTTTVALGADRSLPQRRSERRREEGMHPRGVADACAPPPWPSSAGHPTCLPPVRGYRVRADGRRDYAEPCRLSSRSASLKVRRQGTRRPAAADRRQPGRAAFAGLRSAGKKVVREPFETDPNTFSDSVLS